MPIYEYRCAVCGHQDEHLQKVSDAQLTVCPACGKPKYQKQLSAAGLAGKEIRIQGRGLIGRTARPGEP